MRVRVRLAEQAGLRCRSEGSRRAADPGSGSGQLRRAKSARPRRAERAVGSARRCRRARTQPAQTSRHGGDCQLSQPRAQYLLGDCLDNHRPAVSTCWTIPSSRARPARRCVLARRRPANLQAIASTRRRRLPDCRPSRAASRDKLTAPSRGASSCTSIDLPTPGSPDTKTNSGAPEPLLPGEQACQDSDPRSRDLSMPADLSALVLRASRGNLRAIWHASHGWHAGRGKSMRLGVRGRLVAVQQVILGRVARSAAAQKEIVLIAVGTNDLCDAPVKPQRVVRRSA